MSVARLGLHHAQTNTAIFSACVTSYGFAQRAQTSRVAFAWFSQ